MASSPVSGLRSVELGVTDVAAHEKFYIDVWQLALVERKDGASYLRGTGAEHHVLALHPHPRTELLSITLSALSRADVEALATRLRANRVNALTAPAPMHEPGGGYGISFRDPEGRVFRVIAEDQRHADAKLVADRPERLAHVVLNAVDKVAAAKFFVDVLGFKLSDRTRIMDFIRCNSDHHSLSFAVGQAATLNHIAFQMPDLESVMRGAGRLKDAGYPIEWGVGRHGPGNNVFSYFVAPGDVVIEYTAEVEQVDDTYKTGAPEDWTWPAGRMDRWGIASPPTARLKEAQNRVGFVAA